MSWQRFKVYARMPEMRFFWLFLALALFIAVINVIYLPQTWQIISLASLFGVGAVMFASSVQTARINYDLKVERNRLDIIIGNLRDGVVVYDEQFKILLFNKAAEQIFDLKSPEVLSQVFTIDRGKNPRFQLFAQVMFPSLAPAVVRRSEAGVYPQMLDLIFEKPDLELRVITSQIIDAKGVLLGFVKVVRDRTRETQLLRAKSEFVAVASQQLQSPLGAAREALQNLQKESLAGKQKELADAALWSAVKLDEIVEDLLEVAKIEEGRFGYDFQEIDLVEFLKGILAGALPTAKEYKINLYFNPPKESLPKITADPNKLGIAIANLLENAVKYNVPNGQVALGVELYKDRPYVLISVKDTGVGIPPEDLDRLFTKFHRSKNVKSIEATGSGLGLYIVKNIVMRHGGKIWVESALNRGTTFYFTLPTDPKLIPPKEIVYGEE
jgi:two-component system phosphate regulon sensor histidine kinase PhoR